ncbi:hypothetical protein JCM6882_002313 [Rhodosporidiobolus microsporus]
MDLSSPPPDLFGKLPLELLKHIVALVKVQDEAFRRSTIHAASSPCYDELEEDWDAFDQVSPREGEWSVWYGAGVQALSLCDKQFRDLTSPYLFRTATPAKLRDPLFTLGFLDEYLEHVVHLDMGTALSQDDLLACAAALPRLPNLCEFTFSALMDADTDPLNFYRLFMHGEEQFDFDWQAVTDPEVRAQAQKSINEDKLLRRAFLKFFGRVTRVCVRDALPSSVGVLLENMASPLSLRELEIHGKFFSEDGECLPMLQRFSLDHLVIDHPYQPAVLVPPRPTVTLPTLTSLSIRLSPGPEETLRFVERAAPNLRRLVVFNVSNDGLPAPDSAALRLPYLTDLTLSGIIGRGPLLRLFRHSPIRHLGVQHTLGGITRILHIPFDNLLPLSSLDPFSSLRRVRLHLPCLHPLSDVDEFEEERTPTASPSTWYGPRTPTSKAVVDTLQWALRRVAVLRQRGDREGMEELADALRWLRQRQVIEEQ